MSDGFFPLLAPPLFIPTSAQAPPPSPPRPLSREFEYLTARIAFLQGLFHWLASVALELLIPKEREGVAARRMNMFTSSALATILVAMLSFLNGHMTFYRNYAHMLQCYCVVLFRTFLWPAKPLTLLMVPMTALSAVLGVRAFATAGEEEEEDESQ